MQERDKNHNHECSRRTAVKIVVGTAVAGVTGCSAGNANKSKDMSMAVADADRMQERQLDEVGVTEVDAANIDAALQPDQSMRDDASLVEEMDANVQVPEDDWLTGGTSSLPNDVPNMIFGPPDACVVFEPTTSGPCTTEPPIERRDISEGWTGLPMWLGLKLVSDACEPVANALVHIWHTNIEGSYSGETPRNDFCLFQSAYAEENFFRGAQRTSAEGVVWFRTCYPGWYPGRAIHIHFRVTASNIRTQTSQLFFTEALTSSIFSRHPEYVTHGLPNVSNRQDGVVRPLSATEFGRLVVNEQRDPRGFLIATKTLSLRGS